MIPFDPDHPAIRIRNLPRPSDHDGYRDVDPTLQVPRSTVEDPAPEPFEVVAETYVDVRAELLADLAPEWSDEHDTLRCPCGYLVEDDGTCPEGCTSPFLIAGLI